jgi:hypothetical protein
MAENYKHLYEQTKKMLTMYQDELIPGFRKKIEELEAKVATDNNVGKWIPVTERLPEKDVRVLVWMKDNEEGYTQMDTDRWSCTMEQGYHWVRWGKNVTHWMPLPEPPKEVE